MHTDSYIKNKTWNVASRGLETLLGSMKINSILYLYVYKYVCESSLIEAFISEK